MALKRPWRSTSAQDGFVRLHGHNPRPVSKSDSRLRVARLGVTGTVDPATDPRVLPTGAAYTSITSLIQAGDIQPDGSADWGAIIARAAPGQIVTFPEGDYVCSDFNSGFQAGISIAKHVKGIIGSGKGTVGGSTGTRFIIKPMSSTKGNGARDGNGNLYVPIQDNKTPCQLNVMKQNDQDYPGVWKNFQVVGTEQGHIFSAFQLYNTKDANTLQDILVTGWSGDNGAPPGETSAIAVSGPGAHVMRRIEVDGRRVLGGVVYGAMGLTFQNNVGATWDTVDVHHCRVANLVAYQSFLGTMTDCTAHAIYNEPQLPMIGNGAINFERAVGYTWKRGYIGGRMQHLHATLSTNGGYSLFQNGVTYVAKNVLDTNGSLHFVDVDYNDLWGNNRITVQSWQNYPGTGDQNIMWTTNGYGPTAQHSDGSLIPLNWISEKTVATG